MHTTASLYYHCSSLLGAGPLAPGIMLAVPGLGAALMWVQKRRRAS